MMSLVILKKKILSGILISVVFCATAIADTNFDLSVRSGGFSFAVGNYDYLPYVPAPPPVVSFDVALQEYGSWVTVSFGRAWRPIAPGFSRNHRSYPAKKTADPSPKTTNHKEPQKTAEPAGGHMNDKPKHS